MINSEVLAALGWINTNHQFCDITACKVSEDEFCNRAERIK